MVITRIKAWLVAEATDCLKVTLLAVLVLLWMAVLAVGLPLILTQVSAGNAYPADEVVLDLELTALLGLAAGGAARLILRKRTVLLQLAAASAGVVLSLGIIGHLSGGRLGLRFSPAGAEVGAVRLLVSMVLSWLFLLAFRRSRQKPPAAARPVNAESVQVRAPRIPVDQAGKNRRGGVSWAGGQKGWGGLNVLFESLKRRSGKLFSVRKKSSKKPGASGARPAQRTVVKSSKTRISGRRAQAPKKSRTKKKTSGSTGRKRKTASRVQTVRKSKSIGTHGRISLNGSEEHRCPYCLEEVERNDPRGVKICPVCHTWHHADCWDVTGTCQVPHKHE